MRQSTLFPILTLLVTPALADTIIVDDDGGPGVDYQDIPPAVQAAVSGDLILVYPGSYSGFTVDKELTLIGTPPAVTGNVVIDGSAGGVGPIVLSSFQAGRIAIQRCREVVVLEDVSVGADTDCLSIDRCSDVRVHGSSFGSPDAVPFGGHAVNVTNARAEFVECEVFGPGGPCPDFFGDPGAGLHANLSEVHFALSSATGLMGMHWGSCGVTFFGGDGGNGLTAVQSRLLVSGLPSNRLSGGDGGSNYGLCGYAVRLENSSSMRVSGVALSGGFEQPDHVCHAIDGGPAELPHPPDPCLEIQGQAVPGGVLPLRVNAPDWSEARLLLGRHAVITPTLDGGEDRLTSEEREIVLGIVPAGGVLDTQLRIPPTMPKGTVVYAQVLLRNPVRLSHSVPIVVH